MNKIISIETIQNMLKDSDWRVRTAAMNACQGRDVPLDVIERGLKDSDCDVRTAAMNACQGRDVPLNVIERWLKDSDWRVRTAAMNACKFNGYEIPIIRTIEPPEVVFKKCIGNVIICAVIPKDAQVRGSFGEKCRASKAIITDIIGDIMGEKVGISKYNPKCVYYIGDEVVIDDFDYSNEECSRGYHFFCTLLEAKNY